MNKHLILEKVINLFNDKILAVDVEIKEVQEQVKNSPTAMESHSDTSRFQSGVLLQNLQRRKEELIKVIDQLTRMTLETREYTRIGSIIALDSEDLLYLLLPQGAGFLEFEIEGIKVVAIGVDTILGKSLNGHKIGDDFTISLPRGEKNRKIKSIS
jgi:hypothetical protein